MQPNPRLTKDKDSPPAKGCVCKGGCGGKNLCGHGKGEPHAHVHTHAELPPLDHSHLLRSLLEDEELLILCLGGDGRILWLNHSLETLCGWPSEELPKRDGPEVPSPLEDQAAVARQCLGNAGGNHCPGHVNTLRCRDGILRHVEWRHDEVKGADGKVTGMLCIGRDVSDLQAAREALASSETCNSAVLETAVNAIVTMSETGVVESVNSAAERIFGYAKKEMVGQNIKMLMPHPFRDQHDHFVQRYLGTGEKKVIGTGREVVAQHKDGTLFPIDVSVGEAILPDGRRIFTGILRDLSDRKQLEEKILHISEEEQQRIGQDIHDDLCQQLAAIGCLAKVALQQLQKGGQVEAESLQEILRLVTHANVRAREMSRGLMPVVLDSSGLMAALADLAQGTERVFRVSCPFRCDKPVQVPDNKVAIQLFRIAQEAVANAIKHSGAERIEINLLQDKGQLLLCISDNGIGISDPVTGKTTGMGLLTMNHRARMMGGVLSVDRGGHGGTLVQCRVPLPTDPKGPSRRTL
jgi:PAS domain S-box-containing protein